MKKNNSKWIKDLNIKYKNIKLLGYPHESGVVLKPCMAISDTPSWYPGKTEWPGSPTTSLRTSNFWMIIQNVSLWEQTIWVQNRCNRSAGPSAVMLSCWWERAPWCAMPSEDIWRRTQIWKNCYLISGRMWAFCSWRWTSLRSGAWCWPIRCQGTPMLVP